MNSLYNNQSLFNSFREEELFKRIKDKLPPTDTIVDALSFGLISRDGETSFSDFRARIESHWPDYMKELNEACKSGSFGNVPKAVRLFLNRIKSDDIVDEGYPLFQTIGNPKNSFCDVRLLKSLSVICTDEVMAPNFLYLLVKATKSDPLNYLNYTALAQLHLERRNFRKAADFALEAMRLRAGDDLCTSKTIVSTQKALFLQGMKPDINHVCSDKNDLFCEKPFKVFSIFQYLADQPLSFFMCNCRAWAPAVFSSNLLWNGFEAQEFRHSILDGSFRYCDELACPFLMRNSLPKRANISDLYLREIIDNCTVILDKGPRDLVLAYDRSCNLSCPSCRDKIFMADKVTTEYYDKTMDGVLPLLLVNAKTLSLSNVGEALASKHFRHLLKSITPTKYPNLRISIITNLKLISKKIWDDLGETASLINTLHLSIDGATPQTLEKLRRGLKWNRMLDALDFIQGLRTSSKLVYVSVNFIIQKDNFRELPKMIELCSSYCLDALLPARISYHGSYTNDQFRDIDVGDPNHPLHTEYIDVIKQTVALHKEMEKNASKIMASRRSVPYFKPQPI